MTKKFRLSQNIELQDGATISIDKEVVLKASSWEELGQKIIESWRQEITPISDPIIALLNRIERSSFNVWSAIFCINIGTDEPDEASFDDDIIL